MNNINFKTNWNKKLNCKCFTSIRLHNPQKCFISEVFAVILNNRVIGYAKLRQVKTIGINEITDYMAMLDTGYNAAKTREIIYQMYKHKAINWKTQKLDYCLFEYENPQTEINLFL